jgi:hypothetical protein
VLFVTPEYNRSIPGALKNAIDWASRPWGKNSFSRKPSAVIGTSPGKIGTAVGQQHLRSIMAFCNSPLFNAIERLHHARLHRPAARRRMSMGPRVAITGAAPGLGLEIACVLGRRRDRVRHRRQRGHSTGRST